MKFLIETGSESHTSSYARMQAKYHGGEHDGKFLYEVKSYQVSAEWSYVSGGKHGKWCMTVYELPEGTEIELIGKSYAGDLHQIYRLDPSAEVIDESLCRIGGVTRGDYKGRLVLVRDILASKADAVKKSQQEDF